MPKGFSANRLAVQVADREELTLLERGAPELGLALSGRQTERLLSYLQLLKRWNRTFNLVGRRDLPRLVPRHLLDSLSIWSWLYGTRVLDLGSGAGLPGIPLAVVAEDRQFFLVDRNARKTRFLQQVVTSLQLDNVHVRCVDAARIDREPAFTTVLCRGVGPLERIWPMAGPLLAADGRVVVMSRSNVRTTASTGAASVAPRDVNVTRKLVWIPGLSAPHEVLVAERGA